MNNEIQIKNLITQLDENFRGNNFTTLDSYEYHSIVIRIRDFIYKEYASISDIKNKQNKSCDEIEKDAKENLNELINVLFGHNRKIGWDKNWSFSKEKNIYSKQFGQFLLYKAGEYRLVEPFHFIDEDTSNHLADEGNHYVNIKIINAELLTKDGGLWYYIRGSHYLGVMSIVRFYLNLNSDFKDTLKFLKSLSDALNSRQIPFHFKFTDAAVKRTDSAVLYFHQEHYHIVFLVFQQIYLQYFSYFENRIPLFTKYFGLPGVGFAEDPMISGESFGLSRAKVIAEYYANYYRINCRKCMYEYISENLSRKGYLIDEFYRNPNTCFPYDFSVFSKIDLVNEIQIFKTNKLPVYVANLICKQAIVTNFNGQVSINWVGAFIEDEYDLDNTYYQKVDITEKKAILFFLITVLKYLRKDWLIKYYCQILIENINRLADEKIDFESIFKRIVLNKKVTKQSIEILNFKEEIKKRGVSSILKDDAFNPLNYIKIAHEIINEKSLSDKLKELLNQNINRYLSAFVRSALDI